MARSGRRPYHRWLTLGVLKNETPRFTENDRYYSTVGTIFRAARDALLETPPASLDIGRPLAEKSRRYNASITASYKMRMTFSRLPTVTCTQATTAMMAPMWLPTISAPPTPHNGKSGLNQEFVRWVVHSIIFAGNAHGHAAENLLCKFLLEFFDAESWMYDDHYRALFGQPIEH